MGSWFVDLEQWPFYDYGDYIFEALRFAGSEESGLVDHGLRFGPCYESKRYGFGALRNRRVRYYVAVVQEGCEVWVQRVVF
jgi:hypothetical protein